jgi:hypothetical protein
MSDHTHAPAAEPSLARAFVGFVTSFAALAATMILFAAV